MISTRLGLTSLICSLPFFLASCASTDVSDVADVNQKKIHQHYKVDINAETGRAEAEAQFRFGGSTGTTLMLTGSSNVVINGEEMDGDEKFLRGLVYSQRVADDATNYEYVFTDANGDTYTNKLLIEAIELDNLPESLSGRESRTITWKGAPCGKNEKISVHVSSENDIGGWEVGSTSTNGATSIDVNPEDVREVLNGPAEIYLVRRVDKPLDQEADEGGDLVGEYTSEHLRIDIIDAKTKEQQAKDEKEFEDALNEL